MSGVRKEAYNLNFWNENADPRLTPEPPKKKKRRRANSVWDESQRLIDSWRAEVFPKRVVFLDYGDGYAIIESSGNGNELVSNGGNTDGVVPITRQLEAEKPEVIDVPDNVRKLARARYYGYLGKKEGKRKKEKEEKKAVGVEVIFDREDLELIKEENGVRTIRVIDSTIKYDDGGNLDQAFPNPRVEDVDRQGLHRMAEIQKNCSRKAKRY